MTKYSTSYVNKQTGNDFGRGRNQRSMQLASQRLGPVSNVLIIFALISLLGLLYLNQVKKTGELTFELQQLEQRRTTYREDNQALEVKSLRQRSLVNIQQSASEYALVDPQEVERAP